MKKVFVILIEQFGQETEILNVCSDLKKCKEEILKYLYKVHFDNELTDDSEENFIEKYINNFEENYDNIIFPDDFDIYYVEKNLI
jgi:hypothetical protein